MRRFIYQLLIPFLMLTAMSVQAQNSLPTIAITTSTPLNAQKKVTAHMKMEGYDGKIGIKLRGNSSLTFNQKKYTIELRSEDGKEIDAPLLGVLYVRLAESL